MDLLKVMSVGEVRNLINKEFRYELDFETISIKSCVGRVCYNDMKVKCNIPEFKKSTVDGFAVCSRDTFWSK